MSNRVTNQVTLIGRLGDDPTFFGENDRGAARFDLATNEVYGRGEARQERTDWHKIVCWNGPWRRCISSAVPVASPSALPSANSASRIDATAS